MYCKCSPSWDLSCSEPWLGVQNCAKVGYTVLILSMTLVQEVATTLGTPCFISR